MPDPSHGVYRRLHPHALEIAKRDDEIVRLTAEVHRLTAELARLKEDK